MAEQCEDAWVPADAAGVLAEGSVEDVVEAVLDGPVAAEGLGQGLRRRRLRGEVVGGGFLARDEAAQARVEAFDLAAHLDHGLEVVVPGLGPGARRQGPDARGALLYAVAPPQ